MKYKVNFSHTTHPGLILRKLLEENNILFSKFARNNNIQLSDLIHIIQGKKNINENIAKILEKRFLIPANFWIEKQKAYNKTKQKINYIN